MMSVDGGQIEIMRNVKKMKGLSMEMVSVGADGAISRAGERRQCKPFSLLDYMQGTGAEETVIHRCERE